MYYHAIVPTAVLQIFVITFFYAGTFRNAIVAWESDGSNHEDPEIWSHLPRTHNSYQLREHGQDVSVSWFPVFLSME